MYTLHCICNYSSDKAGVKSNQQYTQKLGSMVEKQEPFTVSAPPWPCLDGGVFSPGPMTLVSRFFSDCYPDPEHCSFSQLLAGAMQSPMAVPVGDNSGFKQSRPLNLVVPQPSLFIVPPGLSPSELLNSPGFFSPQSPFGMSHKQALAQVTAQAALSQSYLHFDYASAPSLLVGLEELSTYHLSLTSDATTDQRMQPLPATYSKSSVTQSSNVPSSDKKSETPNLAVDDKAAADGYNWRKYGHKQLRRSEFPRSYYKCAHLDCQVKKQVERSLDGQITEIIYRGQHKHEQPQSNRRTKNGSLHNGNIDPQAKHELDLHGQSSIGTVSAHPVVDWDEESNQATSIEITRSGNQEEVDAEMKLFEDDDDCEPNSKRRNTETGAGASELGSIKRTVTEPKIIVQTRTEFDLLDDGYKWRKYGKKVVKGNTHPRSYYKCAYVGCNVRKHVERASTDTKALLTAYEGKHNHNLPAAARANIHTTTNLKVVDCGNDQRPAVLQLKEE